MSAKKKRKLGSRQRFLLGLIYDEPFITYEELHEEMVAEPKFKGRGAHGLKLALGSMVTHGWVTTKGSSYLATRNGKQALLTPPEA